LNDKGYLAMPGLNVMLAQDYYPEGHQGGVGIIQNGVRVATNGDLRLNPTPGQWQPTPAMGDRTEDAAHGRISVRMSYPDPAKNHAGFNPVHYPDLELAYTLSVVADGPRLRIVVDLDEPLPEEWVGRVGFNLELFPGILFGKSFQIGGQAGIFPLDGHGPAASIGGEYQFEPLGGGRCLTVAAETESQRMTIEAVRGGELLLLDGRARHNNGWFVVRSLVEAGATKGAIEWIVSPHAIPGWKAAPVIQIPQIGYHARQEKIAVIELDASDADRHPAILHRLLERGGLEQVVEREAAEWGTFLRSRYLKFDFSDVTAPGMYVVEYAGVRTPAFKIGPDVFKRHVWQPTVEYFLPVQMCHMRVRENYRVWHGLCHLDDALMAPTDMAFYDNYKQGPSTLTRFAPGDHVPGLDRGGWHDAGDYDIRVESVAGTVRGLSLAWELFHPDFDNTTIDQETREVVIHQPDGKPDVLQQIEHGLLSIVGAYNSMGRLYRGIIESTLPQYTHLGDAQTMTDNVVFDGPQKALALETFREAARNGDQRVLSIDGLPLMGMTGAPDDRWVFTEDNPARELDVAAGLAAASRAMRGYDDALAAESLRIATELWNGSSTRADALDKLGAALELLQTTGERRYAEAIAGMIDEVAQSPFHAWLLARALPLQGDEAAKEKIRAALVQFRGMLGGMESMTPYGIPYMPAIWGAGWGVQSMGVSFYYLHRNAPDLFSPDYTFRALDFVLGCHPGANPASFVSGVGARSVTMAYGINRADRSYIPGGSVSGTALIRPDFPELLEWPYLWQQTEYCIGAPTSDYVFLVLAADSLASELAK
jgi:hypothetical protein